MSNQYLVNLKRCILLLVQVLQNHMTRQSILLVIISVLLFNVYGQEIELVKHSVSSSNHQQIKLLPVTIGNQTFKVSLSLNSSLFWIKHNKCFICTQQKCRQTCDDKIGPAKSGLVCSNETCKATQKIHNDSKILGQQLNVTLQVGKKKILNVSVVGVEKIKFKTNKTNQIYDGELGIFNQQRIFNKISLRNIDNKTLIVINDQIAEWNLDLQQRWTTQKINNSSLTVSELSFDYQIINVEYKTFITLNKQPIVIPQPIFELMKIKINKLAPKCKIEKGKVICEDKSSLNNFKNILLGIRFDDNRLMIVFSSVCFNCKEKECEFLMQSSKEMIVELGTVFLNSYGTVIDVQNNIMKFHRLKNPLAPQFHKTQRDKGFYPNQQSLILTPTQNFAWHLVNIIFRVIVVIALYYTLLKLYLDYGQIFKKFKLMFSHKLSLFWTPYQTISQKQQRSQSNFIQTNHSHIGSFQPPSDDSIQNI